MKRITTFILSLYLSSLKKIYYLYGDYEISLQHDSQFFLLKKPLL